MRHTGSIGGWACANPSTVWGVSSSGLIYAVIVGAWAAYLVPMWLRRQDELNEARPTERFSTAIRLLSGRAAMERRYARELEERAAGEAGPDVDPDAVTDRLSSVDVRAFAVPPTQTQQPAAREGAPENAREEAREQVREERRARTASAAAERARRSKVLARRRRTTVVLFLAFTLGAIVAAVGGLQFLWAPAVPAVLLSTYIVHLRSTERRRFAFTMDRRRAEAARSASASAARTRPAGRSPRSRTRSRPYARSPSRCPPCPRRKRAGAHWWSRRPRRNGWTSSASGSAARPAVRAGTRSRSRCRRT